MRTATLAALVCALLLASVLPVASGGAAASTVTAGTDDPGTRAALETSDDSSPPSIGGTPDGSDPDGDGNATPPGTWLYGIVGVQDADLRAETNRSVYETRLATADSPAATARVVDHRLATVDRRLDALERRRDRLERERNSGAVSAGEHRARAARLVAEVRGVERILERSERAVAELPEDQRERRRLDDRIDTQRTRVDAILDEELLRGASAIDGSDRQGGAPDARPVDVGHLERAIGESEVPGRLGPVFGNERVTVHVRRANGSVARYNVRTRDGVVTEIGRGSADDPTLHVFTTHEVVRESAAADDPWAAVDRGLSEDRVTVRGVGIEGTAKFWATSALYEFYDGLRSLVGGIADLIGV